MTDTTDKIKEQNMQINRILQEFDEQYHRYAVHIGVSEPALWVLYSLYAETSVCTQNTLALTWSCPKQTINFAISGLVKKGLVELAPIPSARNSKSVHLTDEGKAFCAEKLAPLLAAEEQALLRMQEEERELLLTLLEKQKNFFAEEVEQYL